MGAAELLHRLRGKGLVLTLTAAGGLHAAPRDALTDEHRDAIRAARDALVQALLAEASCPPPPPPPPPPLPRRSGNPLMTPEQGDDCHDGGWDDAEIEVFMVREARFMRLGRATDAEHLAERLTLRDREQDDRRLCLECAALADNRRCELAAQGRLAGADRRLEPVPTVLQRCPGFTLAPGLN
jgi:hypothetical protein